MTFERDLIKPKLAALARQGVYLGTSSWKYPGWLDQLYTRDRYIWRGRFAKSRFEHHCLAEYSEVFKTVCVDAAYYKFPRRDYLAGMVDQVPSDFQFAFKVTDEITMRRFPSLPRFGQLAGQINKNFLNADLFTSAFIGPCEEFRPQVGMMIFEFTRFHSSDFAGGQDFVEALDPFLNRLPQGWRYGVEIRNRSFLQPEYFAALARHQVAHVFNSWTDMPGVEEQIELPGAFTSAGHFGARFLLRPGRVYADAVKRFSPYERLQDPNPEGRRAGATLVKRARSIPDHHALIYLNNRFEGNALASIAAMIEEVVE